MFIFDWIRSFIAYLGFKQNAKLLIIGLDNAGKSTLLDMLASGRLVQHPPTARLTCKQLDIGNIRFTAYDLGGHIQARRVWRTYFPAIDAIIFVVDSADVARVTEAKVELEGLLSDESIIDIPIAVLFNKTDIKISAGEEYLSRALGIDTYKTGKEHKPKETIQCRPFETFPCSILRREGYGVALRWLCYYTQ